MFPVSKLFLLVFILWSSEAFAKDSYPPPCDSKIYCVGGPGTLLHTVQVSSELQDHVCNQASFSPVFYRWPGFTMTARPLSTNP